MDQRYAGHRAMKGRNRDIGSNQNHLGRDKVWYDLPGATQCLGQNNRHTISRGKLYHSSSGSAKGGLPLIGLLWL